MNHGRVNPEDLNELGKKAAKIGTDLAVETASAAAEMLGDLSKAFSTLQDHLAGWSRRYGDKTEPEAAPPPETKTPDA